jgi:hypothetical protein
MDMIDELSRHPLVVMAARVGKTFRVDPVSLLDDDGDAFLNQVRVAATLVVQRDEEEAAAKAKSGARRRR